MTILTTQAPIEAGRDYVVAGWASVNEEHRGPGDLGRRGGLSEEPSGRFADAKTAA